MVEAVERNSNGGGRKFGSKFTNYQSGVSKTYDELQACDNPLDYGCSPCFECTKLGQPGHHFKKFLHT